MLDTPDGPLPESNAILVYLASGTPLLPDDPFELAHVVRRLVYEQTDVIPAIGGPRFRLLTGRLQPGDDEARRREALAYEALALLDDHLAHRSWLVGDRYTIADIAVCAYPHRAHEAGIDLSPFGNLRAWFARVENQPGYFEDIEPYPANATPGAGRSINDPVAAA